MAHEPIEGSDFDGFLAKAAALVGSDVQEAFLRRVWESQDGDPDRAMAALTESKVRRKISSSRGSSRSSVASAELEDSPVRSGHSPDDMPSLGMVGSCWGHQAEELVRPRSGPAIVGDDAVVARSDPEAGRPYSCGAEGATATENIQVVARFRPLSQRELDDAPDLQCVDFGDDGQSCTLSVSRAFNNEVEFHFNRVFEPEAGQEEVFEAVGRPIAESVMNGFNGAIIAYGQTGSGKTHTMMGPQGATSLIDGYFDDPELGIIPRVLLELQAHARRAEGAVQLRVSYVEIYQEHVIDLLTVVQPRTHVRPKPSQELRQDTERGLYLPQVAEMPVQSAAEAMEIMRLGNRNRTKASTEMNRDSSRSHAVFIVSVANSIDPMNRKFSQLYLVDLAGSERIDKTGVAGKQLDEAKLINRSLLALGQVIWSLSTRAKHIPYRDSKLTRLLQNCLGGNARTCLVCTASPHPANAPESLSTLRFGDRASKVRNEAKMNIALDAAELKKLLEKARAQLTELRCAYQQLERENEALQRSSHLVANHPVPSRVANHPVPPRTVAQVPSTPALLPAAVADSGSRAPERTDGETASPQAILDMIARCLFTRELLPSLICPLTRAVMRDPVCASDGSSYERTAIERHFKHAGRMPAFSPSTLRPFPSKLLVQNVVLKQLIARQLPDLPPLEARIPEFSTICIYLLEEIFTFLNGRSLGQAQIACKDFFAVGSKPSLWTLLLKAELGDSQVHGDPRKQYISEAPRQKPTGLCVSKSRGLHLLPPPSRPSAMKASPGQ